MLAAGVVPNFTAVAPDRLIPEIVTEVPPAAGPDGGLTLFTWGWVVWKAYRSTALVVLVPFGVVTVASAVVLGVPAGAVAVSWLALLTVRPVAATVPNLTEVAPVKLVPEMTTALPPPAGPVVGLSPD